MILIVNVGKKKVRMREKKGFPNKSPAKNFPATKFQRTRTDTVITRKWTPSHWRAQVSVIRLLSSSFISETETP